jgi:hypothetical protein
MKIVAVIVVFCALMTAGCSTEQIGGFAAGYNQARAAQPPQTHTYCTRVGDQILCNSQQY